MKCKICKTGEMRKIFDAVNMHGRRIIDESDTFVIMQCQKCGVVFPSDVKMNSKYFSRYYGEDYYEQGVTKNIFLGNALALITAFSNSRKESMILKAPNNSGKISILDIGCGTGNFLMSLNPTRFEKHGVEISKKGYTASKKRGLNLYLGDIMQINFGKKKFDCISMWHVLEHINDPHKLFEKIRDLLNKNGVLIFQIPLTDSLGFRIGGKYWFHLDVPRHLTLFGDKSIRSLCKEQKFDIIKIVNEPYEYPLDLFWSLRASPFRFFVYPLYPIIKLFDRETVTYVCRKK